MRRAAQIVGRPLIRMVQPLGLMKAEALSSQVRELAQTQQCCRHAGGTRRSPRSLRYRCSAKAARSRCRHLALVHLIPQQVRCMRIGVRTARLDGEYIPAEWTPRGSPPQSKTSVPPSGLIRRGRWRCAPGFIPSLTALFGAGQFTVKAEGREIHPARVACGDSRNRVAHDQ